MPPDFVPPATPSTFQVKLERTACFGACPAFEVTIDERGRVEFFGESCVTKPGPFSQQIPASDAWAIYNQLVNAAFWSYQTCYLDERDGCPSFVTDGPTSFWTVQVDERVKSVAHYQGCMGIDALARLDALEPRVEELAAIGPWVGSPAPACRGGGESRLLKGSYRVASAGQDLGTLTIDDDSWTLADCAGVERGHGSAQQEGPRLILLAGGYVHKAPNEPGGIIEHEQGSIELPQIGDVGSISIESMPDGGVTAHAERAADEIELQLSDGSC